MQFEYDPAAFIKEVEKRPGLWDKNDPSSSSFDSRQKLWKEIAHEMSPGKKLTKADTMELVYQLQKKWKGLRDSFIRSVGNKKNQGHPYVYKHLLHFLLNVVGVPRSTMVAADDGDNASSGSTSSDDLLSVNLKRKSYIKVGEDQDSDERNKIVFTHKANKRKRQAKKIKSESSDDNDDDNDAIESASYMPSYQYMSHSGNGLSSHNESHKAHYIEFANSDQEGDPDKMFLMSLLPHLRCIPQENRLDTQMEIMQVIKNAKTSKIETHYI